MPDYFLTERYPTGLDDYFVVVWWEQRGSGLSFLADISAKTVTAEQLVADTIEMTNYLRARFERAKIYLMGHSGGTFIGLQAAARAPELYHAYLGVAQITYQFRSEQRAYAYMLGRFKELGDLAMVRRLEAAPVGDTLPLPDGYMSVRDIAMHRLGVGTTHDMRSLISGLIVPSLLNREYTVAEKINLWRGKISSGKTLWNQQLSTDLTKLTRLEIPVYFLHGVHDYTVSYFEAKAYYEQLAAPVKGFYSFEHSAHSPLFEEPERMRQIIRRDVLHATTVRADAPESSSATASNPR
jgi:pimeloyl-ACP methyl ester carboxylesterase